MLSLYFSVKKLDFSEKKGKFRKIQEKNVKKNTLEYPDLVWNALQELMAHEELFINARLYAPSPHAMLITELRKHAMLFAYSSGNSLTPIDYSVQLQPTLSGGRGFATLHVFA